MGLELRDSKRSLEDLASRRAQEILESETLAEKLTSETRAKEEKIRELEKVRENLSERVSELTETAARLDSGLRVAGESCEAYLQRLAEKDSELLRAKEVVEK